jgi:hypothetical protein
MKMRYLHLALICVLCLGCDSPPPAPSFEVGDIAYLRVDGSRVQVTDVYHDGLWMNSRGWFVVCRVGVSGQVHRDGILSRDTQITAYTIVRFRGYELTKVQEEEQTNAQKETEQQSGGSS